MSNDSDTNPELGVVAWLDGDRVHASVTVLDRSQFKGALKYAFYLLVDGVKTAQRWYSTDHSVSFAVPVAPGRFAVTVFVRDETERQVQRHIEVNH